MRDIFSAVGEHKAKRIIIYCGGGIDPASDALGLALPGCGNAAVYGGSLAEWGNADSLPMETA